MFNYNFSINLLRYISIYFDIFKTKQNTIQIQIQTLTIMEFGMTKHFNLNSNETQIQNQSHQILLKLIIFIDLIQTNFIVACFIISI